MSQTIQQKQIDYFTKYAGSCLKIWNLIVGQQITHSSGWTGTVVGIKKIDSSIEVEVQLTSGQRLWNSPTKKFRFGKGWNLSTVFTHLTLPREVEKDLETHYWNIHKEHLIYELRNCASHASIDQSTSNTFYEIYNQLMRMNQKRKLPDQTIQEINGYQQILMDITQKLMDITRFSSLSEKAMNPNVRAHFPLPELDEYDVQLVGEWCTLLNNLDRSSLIELIKTDSKAKWESGRLLSARSAEKIARDFYQNNYGKEVTDVSITQIDKNKKNDWRKYDLDVEGLHVDVKNSRRSQKSKDRYTEHCIPQFKRSRENQNVISGVLSPYIWPLDLLDKPKERHEDAEIIFLGETDIEKQSILKCEFNDLVDFVGPNPANKYFLPPWVFDYPECVYKKQNKALKELKDFTNLASLKGVEFKFNLIPVGIAADIDLTEILDNEALDSWERNFLDQLRNRIEKYGLSLPFLFLTILTHFLGMADSSEIVSDFKPDKYRKFLFYKEGRNNPLLTSAFLKE